MNEFSIARLRNNRKSPWIRNLFTENLLSVNDLILPIFVIEGVNKEEKIENLPGVSRFSIDLLVQQVKQAKDLGINAVMLFPVIDKSLKTPDGQEALKESNLMNRAIREIKLQIPQIGIICDIALDPYTTHGHDGIIDEKGNVKNDETIEILCQQSFLQAKSGADILAPSDMMDGRIFKIRAMLENSGFKDVNLMSYAAKYASSFYGPFRNAVGSQGKVIDKKGYQLDYRNSKEAAREIKQDEIEGADAIIIKPGSFYLDILSNAAQITNLPLISYQVSAEYAMLKFAAQKNIFDFEQALLESLVAFKRAGASAIVTYGAIEIAKYLNGNI